MGDGSSRSRPTYRRDQDRGTEETALIEDGWSLGGWCVPGWAYVAACNQARFISAAGCYDRMCVSLGLLMASFLSTLEAVSAASLSYAAVLMVFIGVMIQDTGSN
ncbi:hypothetical protein BJX99DRAFT_160080 [Aspergillus californicus]